MKSFIHKQSDININIFSWDENNTVRCEFLKEKPVIGDVLMSMTRRESNFMYVYRIDAILENRDSRVQPPFNGRNAFYEIQVSLINETIEVEKAGNKMRVFTNKLPEGYASVDNSTTGIY